MRVNHHTLTLRLAAALVAAVLVMLTLSAPAASAKGQPVLRIGAHGPKVAQAQRLLHVPADGIFGRRTAAAVRRFQKAHHLLSDGVVGPRTWSALHRGTRSSNSRRTDGMLRLGEKGDRVATLQRRLHIRVNRLFDKRTWLAVKAFQRRRHLYVDGVVGPQTWSALNRRSRAGHTRSNGRRTDGMLRLGEKGDRVATLQRRLHIRVNRLFDKRTWLAVKAFQRRRHLYVDGVVGPQTWGALRSGRSRGGSLGAQAARLTRQYRGVRYVWGGKSPRGFDCSGLIWFVYGRLGVDIPRVTYAQWHSGRHVRRSDLQPGDLVFFNRRSHVGLWLGHGWFMHAPRRGQVVHASQLKGWYATHYDGAVRFSR